MLVLQSHKGKVLGRYPATPAGARAALKREKQIRYFASKGKRRKRR
jgi:hypothetical protein